MIIKILRGTNEIGGTCIQLSTESTTILLDLGQPLKKESREIELSGVMIDAVLVSHPHQDHYGLINMLDSTIPVYIGKVGKELIDATRVLLRQELPNNNFRFLEKNRPFSIGDFKVTPYLMDHSAVDAFAFMIEAEGKRLFYSGDFRAHGRKSVLFEKIVAKPPKDIDVLFMEGTMIRRDNDDFPDEDAVEEKICKTIKDQDNISFLISSSQNVDRIVSAYRACLRAKKIFVIDMYTAWVLERIKGISKSVPSMDWEHIRVFAEHGKDMILKDNTDFFGDFRKRVYMYRVTKEEIRSQPAHYLCLSKVSKFMVIDSYKGERPVNVIYSQWLGYLNSSNEECFGAEEMAAYQKDPQVNFVYAHTSGHATLKDLQRFAKALNPKMLVPIHTEYGYKYCKYFENVLVLGDKTPLSV